MVKLTQAIAMQPTRRDTMKMPEASAKNSVA